MSGKNKTPMEKRSPMSEWKSQQRAKDLEALELAKSQNKPVKFLTK